MSTLRRLARGLPYVFLPAAFFSQPSPLGAVAAALLIASLLPTKFQFKHPRMRKILLMSPRCSVCCRTHPSTRLQGPARSQS